MARYRLSDPAKADIARILQFSQTQHGLEARMRYRGLLTAALRRIAGDPEGISTLDRSELSAGLRSLHTRHVRAESFEHAVAGPVHIIFFRRVEPMFVEIVRVLHERMEPSRHVGEIKAPRPRL